MMFPILKFICLLPLKIVLLPFVLILNFQDCYGWEDYWDGIRIWFED
jgi:hypothetical protein